MRYEVLDITFYSSTYFKGVILFWIKDKFYTEELTSVTWVMFLNDSKTIEIVEQKVIEPKMRNFLLCREGFLSPKQRV